MSLLFQLVVPERAQLLGISPRSILEVPLSMSLHGFEGVRELLVPERLTRQETHSGSFFDHPNLVRWHRHGVELWLGLERSARSIHGDSLADHMVGVWLEVNQS